MDRPAVSVAVLAREGTLANARRRSVGRWGTLALLYGVFTLAITYPVGFQLATHLAGARSGDAQEFVWSMWWWKHSLLDLRQNPTDISVINYPVGMALPLLPTMSQSFLMGLPLTVLISPVVAYNVVFLLSFVLSGLAGYALCHALTQDDLAAFVGGLVWTFFPNKLGHALAGHLFNINLFSLSLAALAWMRLLETPTSRRAVWAGLMIGLAATTHSSYVAYFTLPTLLVLTGHALWTQRRAFWARERVRALAIAFGLGGLLIGLLVSPVLIQASQGKLTFLAERGATGFAFDALAYFVPPPNNPFVRVSPVAYLAGRIVISEYESIGYLGWVPLLLAIIGARSRWRESRAWVWLGVLGAILALGPLLKVGGPLVEVPVEEGTDKYPVLLPYALVGQLPFFQWSRTPGRLAVVVMLALSVLTAFGVQRMLGWLASRAQAFLPTARLLLVVAVSAVILLEYIVKYPFPTIPADIATPIQDLRGDTSVGAVMVAPWQDNEANLRWLLWQTVHAHPMVGGRVYRDLPHGRMQHDFLSRLLMATESTDIVPLPTDAQRRGVLTAMNIGGVVYDVMADSPDGALRSILASRLGAPIREADNVALFKPERENLQAGELVWVADSSWQAPQDWGGQTGRWLQGRGSVYVFGASPQSGRLMFTAIPGQGIDGVRVLVNGQQAGRFAIGDWAEYLTDMVTFQLGLNQIEFIDDDGTRLYLGDPRCAGGSPIAGPYPVRVSCDATDRETRQLSVVIAGLQLVPESTRLPITPNGARFGEALQLVGFRAPEQVKPGEPLTVRLVWRGLSPSRDDFTIFVHWFGPDGNLAAQHDSPPAAGSYPTSIWAEGQIVVYNVTLSAPADLPPGRYSLRLGVYQWPSLERLSVRDVPSQNNTVELATTEVKP